VAIPVREWKRVRTTSSTDASFPARIATTTEPVDDGVWTIPNGEDTLELVPFGIANDDHTCDMRVIGWRKIETLWVPIVITQVALTHCTAVGVASAAVLNTERFCDTTSVTKGAATVQTVPDNTINYIIVGVDGFRKFEVTFDLGAGTNANALFALY